MTKAVLIGYKNHNLISHIRQWPVYMQIKWALDDRRNANLKMNIQFSYCNPLVSFKAINLIFPPFI